MIGLFAATLLALLMFRDPPVAVTFGSLPIGPAVSLVILGLILRRALHHGFRPLPAVSAA